MLRNSSKHRFVVLGVLWLPTLSVFGAEPANQDVLDRINKLEQAQQRSNQDLQEKDKRIQQLESKLNASQSEGPVAADEQPEVSDVGSRPPEYYGDFSPGAGFKLANTKNGTVNFSAFTYVRYLNQKSLDSIYTDSFGRTKSLDLRNDMQLQKVMLYFKGWVYDPKIRYLTYVWTSNTSQGDPAQVVVAGNLTYQFNSALNVGVGINGLPSTRSMEGQWPSHLKVDYRTIADEYFRGSYTTGILVNGEIRRGLQYKVMIGNNLSQLGVNGLQLDGTFDTFSGAVWWMPSTGEYGPSQGFGDFEMHSDVATRVGLHYTHSTEDKQSQPGKDEPENTQIRISDGTAIFDIDAFAPGLQINTARFQMASLDGGIKYRGYALEAELFQRTVDHFNATGPLPFESLNDWGAQVQASAMLVPGRWQVYVTGSKIFGEYGNPYDLSLGANWFPLASNRKVRVNAEALYLNNSPVGYSSVPFIVGGNGTVFNANVELSF